VSSYGLAAVSQPFGAYVYDVTNVDCLVVHNFTIAGERVSKEVAEALACESATPCEPPH